MCHETALATACALDVVHLASGGTLAAMRERPDIDLPQDPVIEAYKRDVDRTLLREHLKLTPQQRLEKLVAFMRSMEQLRAAARRRS